MSPRDAEGNYRLPGGTPLDMNAELDMLWSALGGWQGMMEYIAMCPDPEDRARYMLEVAKLRARKEVTGEAGGPLLIQLKQV